MMSSPLAFRAVQNLLTFEHNFVANGKHCGYLLAIFTNLAKRKLPVELSAAIDE